MATRSVQFTGARTGRTDLVLPRFGLVHVGDVLDVPEDVAASWTRLLPTTTGEASDFEYTTAVPLEDQTDADVETPADAEDAERPVDPADNQSTADSAESEGDTL